MNHAICWISVYGGTADKLRGHKGSLFDGGIRKSAIPSYPGRIPAGRGCNEVGVMMDVVPILLAFAGVDLPENHSVDGLGDEVGVSQHREVFWEYGKQLAVWEGR